MEIDLQTWVTLLPLFRLALASLEGVGAVAIVDGFKRLFFDIFGRKLPGSASLISTFVVCFFLAILALIVEGIISPESLTTAELLTTFVTVFTVAKVRYDMVRKNQAKKAQLLRYHRIRARKK